MFGWFKKDESDFFYAPKERKIFQFWNGQVVIYEDPMVVSRKISDVGPELKIDLDVADSISKDANKAGRAALEKVQKIFGLKSYADGGLTEDETFEVFGKFLAYRTKLKKNLSQSPTSPEATLPTSAPSSPVVQPIPSSSASGSTDNDPLPEPLTQWNSESELPSGLPTPV